MAFTLVSNPTAISGQGAIRSANNNLSNTIKQLSTGLRINSAADDASGLAVSEKLRGQISGLTVASRNAQDAISYLQTAEAAMGTMISMVQRVRELGVQAGDPAYTVNDRVILQTEVDELLDEINRVSDSAEFNTKKLLNGDAAALWSATDGIEALVNGATVSGNYNIETTMNPGKNNIYKTNIMTVGAGNISFDMDNAAGIHRLDDIKGVLTDANKDIDIIVGKVTATATPADDEAVVAAGSNVAVAGATTTAVEAIVVDGSYLMEMEVVKDVGDTTAGATITDAVRFRITNLATGEVGDWTNMKVVDDDTAAGDDVTISADATVMSKAFASAGLVTTSAFSLAVSAGVTAGEQSSITRTFATDSYITNTGVTTIGSFGDMSAGVAGMNGAGTTILGGSIVFEMEAMDEKVAAGTGSFKYRITNMETGIQSKWYESIPLNANGQVSVSAGGTFGSDALKDVGLSGSIFSPGTTTLTTTTFGKGDKLLFGIGGKTLVTGAPADLTNYATVKFGDGPGVVLKDPVSDKEDKPNKIYTAQMDASGKVYYGSMDLAFSRGSAITTGVTTVNLLGEGDAASIYTELRQLASFTNADGRMLLDNTRELTIYGNKTKTDISLEGTDTIEDLESKFSDAIIESLGLGSTGPGVNDNLVKFIGKDETVAGSDRAVNGTFVIQGAAIGKDSELFFSSDQAILAALGMATIQEGTGSTITATVRDAHTNVFIGKDTITDGVLRGVIKNVDVKLDQTIGSITVWDEVLNKLTFEPNGVSKSTLHLINNPTIAAIGANEGQLLDISIGRLDTTTLNLNNLSVISIADSQKAITKADQALDNINQTRAIIGAQMNRLDYTISNLDVARENMAIADSRIRELDIAEASTRLASEQTILQAASAMLAQANQLPSYAMQLLQ